MSTSAVSRDAARIRDGALLRHALGREEPALSRRVFVNRALRLEKIRCVGFDLDWTLAPYYRLPVEELIFGLAVDRLVAHHDYPAAIRRAEFRPHFPHRGLIIDRQAGTVLKMDRHRYVGRAYHGRQPLDRRERSRLYRQARLELNSDRFYWVDTLFELPEVNLFAELVELRRRGTALPEYEPLFDDVRAAVDAVHGIGPLKERIAADLPRFLPRDPDLPMALERLRLDGRKLLLITNSDWAYTDILCRYLLDGAPGVDSWRDFFSIVVVAAGKPDFFRRPRPFIEVDANGERGAETAVPEWGGVYAQGSREGLMRRLDVPGEKVLYVGDHIYGDVVSSKLTSTWRTCLVLRELEDELHRRSEISPQLRHLEALKSELSTMGHRMDGLRDVLELQDRVTDQERAQLESELEASQAELTELEDEHRALRHRARELQEAIDVSFNPAWGSLFKQGGSQSLFGSQVAAFPCLYTSRVSNLADYGNEHYFRVLKDPLAHEQELL